MTAPIRKVEMEIVNNLYKGLTQELSKVKEEAVLKKLQESLRISKEFTRKLRDYISPLVFEDRESEIRFFKHIKPQFFAHLYFCSEVYYIELKKPIGSIEFQKQFFRSELDKIAAEFTKYSEFHKYLRSEANFQDDQYFLRGSQMCGPDKIVEEADPRFSTGYDFLVANYWANEKIANYLNKKLDDLGKSVISFDLPTEVPKITWTDSKTAFIELAYAFKAKGSFNNGKATLKEITDYLQEVLKIQITNPTRDFQDILRRKTGYANYIDSLKESYLRYIDAIEDRHFK